MMYSRDAIIRALSVYHECGSVSKTICILGYPSRRTLYTWLAKEDSIKPPRKVMSNINTSEHPRNPSHEVKLEALRRCFERGESIESVSADIGYTRVSIYNWRMRYLRGGGTVALMNGKNIKPNTLKAGTPAPTPELEQLRLEMRDMQMEIDILKETINVLKKDPGISQTILKNQEKAVIVDALQDKYSLPCLLSRLIFPRSSYYYQKSIRCKQDKYIDIYEQVSDIFHASKDCYGYRRIHGMLKREGVTVSEKVVRRIMQARNLVVKGKRNKKYNSYQGELSHSVPNVIQRNIPNFQNSLCFNYLQNRAIAF